MLIGAHEFAKTAENHAVLGDNVKAIWDNLRIMSFIKMPTVDNEFFDDFREQNKSHDLETHLSI